jgi:hypothetical protein
MLPFFRTFFERACFYKVRIVELATAF